MKICVLVKEVPDAATAKLLDPASGRIERGGERTLNPFDAHAIEAAVALSEQGDVSVAELVALTMGPPSAVRTLHKAISLGATRAIHLCDDALAGSDLTGSGYALAQALSREAPDLVLLGQQSDDGACFAMAAVIAENLRMPMLTQVVKLDLGLGTVCCERQDEFGYDTVEIELPAVIAVAEAINEPRYPSLKAIMSAKERPIERVGAAACGIDPARVGGANASARWRGAAKPPSREPAEIIDDGDAAAAITRVIAWLEARNLV